MTTTLTYKIMDNNAKHIPVMSTEIQTHLNLKAGNTFVDCTIGLGGHAVQIAKILGAEGRVVGIDRDTQALGVARQRLDELAVVHDLVHKDYRHLDAVLDGLGIRRVDGILMDLGVSSMQLDNAERGFSLKEDGPLDMRMDQENFICAYDLVNSLSEKELSFILKKYGEERWHHRIARFLTEARSKHPIETTQELRDIVWRAVPKHHRYQKIHPATRTFQAIRIAVNRELESLEIVLPKCLDALVSGGRLCVIAFHSLEDHIVKHTFRSFAKEEMAEILTKKPLRPLPEETDHNIRARSARLRVIEKI